MADKTSKPAAAAKASKATPADSARKSAPADSARKSAPADSARKSAAADSARKSAAADDETQRKFREALERKQARDKAGHGEDHLGGRALGLSTNDKTKRQFRRKSGG